MLSDLNNLVASLCVHVAVGGLMEMHHGSLRVALLYLLGVASSSLAFYCFDSGTLQGAPGGVYCIIVSCICITVLSWSEDEVFFLPRFKPGKTPIACCGKLIKILKLSSLITFMVIEFGSALVRHLMGEDIGVSIVANSSGCLAGFLTGFFMLKKEQKYPGEQLLRLACLSVFLLLLLVALVVNVTGYRGFGGLPDEY